MSEYGTYDDGQFEDDGIPGDGELAENWEEYEIDPQYEEPDLVETLRSEIDQLRDSMKHQIAANALLLPDPHAQAQAEQALREQLELDDSNWQWERERAAIEQRIGRPMSALEERNVTRYAVENPNAELSVEAAWDWMHSLSTKERMKAAADDIDEASRPATIDAPVDQEEWGWDPETGEYSAELRHQHRKQWIQHQAALRSGNYIEDEG